MKKSGTSSAALLTLLYALLIGSLLLLVLAGARLYGSILSDTARQSQTRTALSYIQGLAASNRTGIRLENAPEGTMLCLTEGEYETRVYTWKGNLISEYAKVGTPIAPENGEAVCSVSRLELTWETGGTISVTADGARGTVWTVGGSGT